MRYKYKTVDDYVDQVQKQYPYFNKKDIKSILAYGLFMYYYANHFHCDVIMNKDIKRDSITTATGTIFSNWDIFWFNWHTKWRMKERFLYHIKRCKWDGYYYFGLTEEENEAFLKQGKTKALRKKYITKVKNDFHHSRTIKHIWRVPWPSDQGYRFWVKEFKSNKFEYVCHNEYTDYHQWTKKEDNAIDNQSVQSGASDGLPSTDNSEHSDNGCA